MSETKYSQMAYTESMNQFLIGKLDALLKEKGLNKAQFARESGIPYTTIDGFYKRGMGNIRLSTLVKISNFFNISISYFIDEPEMYLPLKLEDVIPKLRDDLDLQNFIVRFVEGLTPGQQKPIMDLVAQLAFALPEKIDDNEETIE